MSFILNFQSPKTLEDLLDRFEFDERTNIDLALQLEEEVQDWTVSPDTQVGDKVFFACAKTSIDHMERLVNELRESKNHFTDDKRFEEFYAFALRERDLYRTYAGHIIGIGNVISEPFEADTVYAHAAWSSRCYASIGDFKLLKEPIAFSAFRDIIAISRTGSRTALTAEQAERLLSII